MADDAFVRQGGEVVALARAGWAEKRALETQHSWSARFTRYRLQSFGNSCDMNGARHQFVCSPFFEKTTKPPPFPSRTKPTNTTKKTKT
jgi:hypothetical protein